MDIGGSAVRRLETGREARVPSYDLVVVGAGVQGLWIGRKARAAGLSVAIVEAETSGAGASGGLLGALMPHMPLPWGDKKRYQFDALVELEALVEELEAATGAKTGYLRSGRIMAIRSRRFRETAIERAAATVEYWRHETGRFRLEVAPPDTFADWLDPQEASHGILVDTLAARIEPAPYIAALKAAFITEGGVLHEGWRFARFDPVRHVASAADGSEIAGARLVLAVGYMTFDIIKGLTGLNLGGGVKGQAALLAASLPSRRPIIYDNGLYVVAHTRQTCAVGSTTETDWTDATSTTEAIDARIAAARRLSLALREARVIRKWAGVRPKAWARDPILGPVDASGRIWVASGGFKITFGIAHAIARDCIDWILAGHPSSRLPASFQAEAHLAQARAKTGPAGNAEGGGR
jgi:glycine oxidase